MIRLTKGSIVREVTGMDAAAPFLKQGFKVESEAEKPASTADEEAAFRKAMAKLKNEELLAECQKFNIEVPEKPTKADMIELLVAATMPPPEV